jgi:hypothetical protein
VSSLSWKGEDEGGGTSLVVVVVEPVGVNVGERGGRGSNDDDCRRRGRVVVVKTNDREIGRGAGLRP